MCHISLISYHTTYFLAKFYYKNDLILLAIFRGNDWPNGGPPPGLRVVADSSFRAATFDPTFCFFFFFTPRRTQTDRKRKANSRRLERTQEGAKKTEIHAHATPSPLLRTASRYKQISLHDAPTALPLRCSPGWFLLSALLLSTRLSCSWRLMDAGRAPTFSSDGGLALLFFFIYMFL